MSTIHQESCQDVRRVIDSRAGRDGLHVPALPYLCLIHPIETSMREYCRKKYDCGRKVLRKASIHLRDLVLFVL